MSTTITPIASGPVRTRGGPPPPEWATERFVKWVGKGPSAVGRWLDGLAKVPVVGWGVRLFSSVIFGLIILGLIAIYIAIGSGFASLRARMEMTDLEFFDAWPMQLLLALLVLDLTIVTLRRIPLTLFKLGPWTVHVGILTLIAGCVVYFSGKQEGSARIYLNQTVDGCYDVTERALYAFNMDAEGHFDTKNPAMTPIPGLPFFYEHDAAHGKALDRALPGALGGLDSSLKDATVRITGYYPAPMLIRAGWRPGNGTVAGETGDGPAIVMALDAAGQVSEDLWALRDSPAYRLIEREELPFGIEYLYHPSAERLRDLEASFEGPLGITVRIPKLKIEKTYTLKDDQPIVVEGSPYTITVIGMMTMPMASKGYENAQSSALRVKVVRKGALDGSQGGALEYERMPVFRYPERTPDFVTENGKPVRKQDGVDPDLQIIFHDATKPQFWVVEDAQGKLTLITRNTEGKSTAQPFLKDAGVGTTGEGLEYATMAIKGLPEFKLRLMKRVEHAVPKYTARSAPPEQRKLAQSAQEVILDALVEVRVEKGNWTSDPVYVPFEQFAEVSEVENPRQPGRRPAVVELPGGGKIGLLLSTTRRTLPSEITLKDFRPEKYPGATSAYLDYYSTLVFKEKATGKTSEQVIHLNNPGSENGTTFFQVAWDGDPDASAQRRFSVIGVGNRPGTSAMIVGAALMVLGIGYAFYAKPVLLKKKKEQLAAWAKG